MHVTVSAIHLTPAMRYPEASHANCKVSRHGFCEAKGSAPLHDMATKTAWMIGLP